MTFQTIRVGDIDIRYELVDHTRPWSKTAPDTILMFHGYSRNMLFWQPLVPLLATDYRVLRFDARGCGGTTKTPPNDALYSIEQYVADAIGLIDALGIERVHWIGESSGGIIGLTAALNHPDRLHTLSVCDTPFKRPADITSIYTLGEVDRATALAKYGVGGWCRQTLSYRLDTSHASAELCEWYIEQMDKTPVDIAIALEWMIRRGDMWPRLPEIKTPTLILGGEKSPIAKESEMKSMRERMPGAKLVALRGYGHGVNLVAPELCAQEIKTFIAAQRGAA